MPKPFKRNTTVKKRTGRGRYIPKKKVCLFCADRHQIIDYKLIALLNRYITDRGRIQARRRTGLCPKHQRRVGLAIKRARYIALMPYNADHIRTDVGFIRKESKPDISAD